MNAIFHITVAQYLLPFLVFYLGWKLLVDYMSLLKINALKVVPVVAARTYISNFQLDSFDHKYKQEAWRSKQEGLGQINGNFKSKQEARRSKQEAWWSKQEAWWSKQEAWRSKQKGWQYLNGAFKS